MTMPVAVRCPPCIHCGKESVVFIPQDAYDRLLAGEHIQNVLPMMPAAERELLISGTHPACWDTIMIEAGEEF